MAEGRSVAAGTIQKQQTSTKLLKMVCYFVIEAGLSVSTLPVEEKESRVRVLMVYWQNKESCQQ